MPQFGLGGVPALLVPEMGLGVLQVRHGHGQPHPAVQLRQEGGVAPTEAFQDQYIRGSGQRRAQGGGLGRRRLPAVHRVHQEGADPRQVARGERALEHVDPGPGHHGPGPVREELQALGRAVGPLVVLAGQVFHHQHRLGGPQGQVLVRTISPPGGSAKTVQRAAARWPSARPSTS